MCQVNGKDKTAKRNYHVPNLDRALQILETLPSFPHGLSCRDDMHFCAGGPAADKGLQEPGIVCHLRR